MNKLDELFLELAKCEKCLQMKNKKGVDCSLINIYKDKNFCTKIPSIWTDWGNRLTARIMIIGQDWGPFVEMQKFHQEYIKEETPENWRTLINEEKSLTKKNLEKFLKLSAKQNQVELESNFLDNIYVTNAILCARKGENYRSDTIKLKECTLNCSPFLKEQIDVVHPKIILTLGYYPLLSLSKLYSFNVESNLTETIKKYPIIEIEDKVIIPLYHPASQIKSEIQMLQYDKIWKHL